ncbi:MAG: hypothetical protein Q4C88_09330 [Akkermansia sp.]|nr:hypothetical protein [Akkermansia sp.]
MKLHLPKMLTAALLAAITAVGSSAFADDAELTTYTTTNSGGTSNNNFNAYGYIITLNGSRLATTPSEVPITTYDRVNLVSVTGNLRNDAGSGVYTGLALTDSAGKVLALSTDSTNTRNTAVTWHFAEGTTVSTDSTLYFLFYKTNNTNIEVGYTFTSSDG